MQQFLRVRVTMSYQEVHPFHLSIRKKCYVNILSFLSKNKIKMKPNYEQILNCNHFSRNINSYFLQFLKINTEKNQFEQFGVT